MEILDDEGALVRTFTTDTTAFEDAGVDSIGAKAGMNRFTWDLTYPGPDIVEDAVIWGYTGGVKAPPGRYQARLTAAGVTQTQDFEVLTDPRLTGVTQEDFEEQFRVVIQVRDTLNRMQEALRSLIRIREQAATLASWAEEAGDTELPGLAGTLQEKLTALQEDLMQTQNQSNQDPIRFPPQLDNQFIELYRYVTGVDGYISGGPEGRPSQGAYERLQDLNAEWGVMRERILEVLRTDVEAFNQAFLQKDIPVVRSPGGP